MKNWKGCRKKQLWPNLGYYPGLFMEGLRKLMKNSVTILGFRADIRTRDLPNTIQ